MYEVRTTEFFDDWLESIRDSKTQMIIVKRIRVMTTGTLGQTRSLGGGLFEAKIHYGQGFRLYFLNKGGKVIVLLCGGGKSTQESDIARAKILAGEL